MPLCSPSHPLPSTTTVACFVFEASCCLLACSRLLAPSDRREQTFLRARSPHKALQCRYPSGSLKHALPVSSRSRLPFTSPTLFIPHDHVSRRLLSSSPLRQLASPPLSAAFGCTLRLHTALLAKSLILTDTTEAG
ncbi:hypothetical protein P153DRAFT_180375 [Dothidotthia symphoricarpi CBS 119687]|uniref:Uncharacterized protein n=1 Tax=Dothidotthia symphoricarpi CBS 119687 TaxID=1392245 RepID=A0A6A6AJZ4_9PLEO|nr:uncharacterized protein P153DRAFT_180375 [Dothidotthia symphoricarpi CBS 119687]KAF2131876.1 hypothetical protein P153DRAFT_180375 [Dothidotthia symphoricarpi CBS 119687]